ncbi:MAG: acylphosphatase [Kiritimatiellia bacterium]
MKPPKEEKQCISVRYTGHVQGVGFRYTVLSLSAGFAVTGFVRNEPDGSVRLEAEGAADELMAFVNAIRQSGLKRYIMEEQIGWQPASGGFSGFTIGHSR